MGRRLIAIAILLTALGSATAYGLTTSEGADAGPEIRFGVTPDNVDAIAAKLDGDMWRPGYQKIVPGVMPKFHHSDYSRFYRTKILKGRLNVGGIHMMNSGGGDMCEGCAPSWPAAYDQCHSPNTYEHCYVNGQSWICYCTGCQYADNGELIGCRLYPSWPCN
jgi:hypothetical protein